MRIALVHAFHAEAVPSGENVVVRAQVDALRAAGHDVALVARHREQQAHRPTFALEAAATVATGHGPDPTADLRAFGPDVVHVHNLFPSFSTRWLAAWDGPLVATVHNYRALCAAGTLLRDGARCTDCRIDPWAGVRHGCFRGSRVATLPLAVAGRRGPGADPVLTRADRVVAISERAVDEYAAGGADTSRFVVVANSVTDVAPTPPAAVGAVAGRWVFVGRLSPEKGLRELLAAWPAGRPLDVIGDGDDVPPAPPGVRMLGGRTNAEVRGLVGGHAGLVVPSQWAEAGPPLTYLEALAAGVPAVAFRGNGAADDVHRHGTGVVVSRRPGTAELAGALDAVEARRDALGAHARAEYERRFSPHAWTQNLLDVYDAAVAAHRGRAGSRRAGPATPRTRMPRTPVPAPRTSARRAARSTTERAS